MGGSLWWLMLPTHVWHHQIAPHQQWRMEVSENDGSCSSASCQAAIPGAVEQSTIDLMCNQCAAGEQQGPASSGAGPSSEEDPCQPAPPECPTPTMTSCCENSPKQWRMEVLGDDGSCASASCQAAIPGAIEQATIDLMCNQCATANGAGSASLVTPALAALLMATV